MSCLPIKNNPFALMQQRLHSFDGDRSREVEVQTIDGTQMPSVYKDQINPTKIVHGLLLGAGGNLATGFFRWGHGELKCALGFDLPIKWTAVDIKDDVESRERIPTALRGNDHGSIPIDSALPYITNHVLRELISSGKIFEYDPKLIFDATPPCNRLKNALDCSGIYTAEFYGEKPFGMALDVNDLQGLRHLTEQRNVEAVDFFVYGDSFLYFLENADDILNGLGEVTHIHASCTEPWTLNAEVSRVRMIMDPKIQGGFIGADQLPHPLSMIHSFLEEKFDLGLRDVEIQDIQRSREVWTPGPDYGETAMTIRGTINKHGKNLEVRAGCGKGINVPGTKDGKPAAIYGMEIWLTDGRVEVCVGSEQVDPYIAIVPNDPAKKTKMILFKDGGLGYKILLADMIAKAQGSNSADHRLNRQTRASVQAMALIAEAYAHALRDGETNPLITYEYPHQPSSKASKPEMFVATRVHPFIERRDDKPKRF